MLLALIAGTLILLMLLSANSVAASQDATTLNPPPLSTIFLSHFPPEFFCSQSPFFSSAHTPYEERSVLHKSK